MTGREWIDAMRARGAAVRLLADTGIGVRPKNLVTAADRAALDAVRDEVIATLMAEPAVCPWGCGMVVTPGLPLAQHVNRECPAALAAVEAAKPEPERCAQCGRAEAVMIGMEPGVDGRPWALCTLCYRGVR